MVLAAIGAMPGLAIGASLPFLIVWGFGAVLPLPLAPALHVGDLALALLYWPTDRRGLCLVAARRAHDCGGEAVSRRGWEARQRAPRPPYVVRPCWSAARWRSWR